MNGQMAFSNKLTIQFIHSDCFLKYNYQERIFKKGVYHFQNYLIKLNRILQNQNMQNTVTFIHKSQKRDFVISSRTKPHVLKQLIKKTFHFQADIKFFRHIGGGVPLEIHQVFNFPNQNQFEIILEDDSDDRSRSENCSQKNMSKLSGRKHPPSERELLDSKFYVDDFQLFMSEVDQAKANRYFGIVFFSNRKKALFLGKKILRQLIFQFDQIEFFYALHPIKMHNTSALLGQVLVFSLFKGKKMIHEREFPEQITAAEEILSYLKNLLKVGELRFNKNNQNTKEKKRSKNLISVSEQRSFDQKNDVLPKKKNYEQKNLTTQFFKVKQVSPQRDEQIAPIRFESPIKSPITNEISFETQFYQPQWFREGDTLTRLQKSFLSALIKDNNMVLINFCQGLQLKKAQKQILNRKLVKVFLDEVIEDRLSCFDLEQKQMIFTNQENRQSSIFSALLKLLKFGNIQKFIQNVNRGIKLERPPSAIPIENKRKKSSYLQVAKQLQRNKKTFSIRLMNPTEKDQDEEQKELENLSLIGKHSLLNMKNEQIAKAFHEKPVKKKINLQDYKISFSEDYTEPDIAHIKELINKEDAFLIQNFIANERVQKKYERLSTQVVKKYITSIEQRYANLRQRTSLSNFCKAKLQKLQIFMSVLYFVYVHVVEQQKQRLINKKQLKAFFYLYIWSDLNVLSAFELYLDNRDVDEMMDTLYTVDYTYYLQGKYGIDMNEVENFTIPIESQLVMLFLLADKIPSIEERLAAEKLIRAGDITLFKIYHDFNLVGDDFTQKALQMCSERKKQIDQLNKNQNNQEIERQQKNQQRALFIEQIKPVHFKTFSKVHIAQECVNLDEPKIHQIFDHYDKTNELVKWIDSFHEYIRNLDTYHMNVILKKFTQEAGLDWQRVQTTKPELLRGIYESYMITTDREDAVDSLQHILKKIDRDERSSPTLSRSISP